MLKLACIGDSCVDHYEELGQSFPGGNPVNFAVYFRRFGAEASFIGAVGSDEDGALVCDALQKKGVDVSHVQVLPGKTSATSVRMEQGNRVFTEYNPGVMEQYALREEDYAFIQTHSLAVSALWGHCENSLEKIKKLGLPVAYDCADLPFDPAAQAAIPYSDILFFSDDSAYERTLRRTIRSLRRQGPKIVVAMRGAKGSLAYDGKRYYKQSALPCQVIDTLGAGDSYIAGFLYAYLSSQPIEACMRTGAENASITIGYVGAW